MVTVHSGYYDRAGRSFQTKLQGWHQRCHWPLTGWVARSSDGEPWWLWTLMLLNHYLSRTGCKYANELSALSAVLFCDQFLKGCWHVSSFLDWPMCFSKSNGEIVTRLGAMGFLKYKLQWCGCVSGICKPAVIRMVYYISGSRLARWQMIFKFTLTYLFCFVRAVGC